MSPTVLVYVRLVDFSTVVKYISGQTICHRDKSWPSRPHTGLEHFTLSLAWSDAMNRSLWHLARVLAAAQSSRKNKCGSCWPLYFCVARVISHDFRDLIITCVRRKYEPREKQSRLKMNLLLRCK